MDILLYLILLVLSILGICCIDDLSPQEQTYLRVSQPNINGPFMLQDALPTSRVMWMSLHHNNAEVSIDVFDFLEIFLRQTIVGHLEEVEVYCNKKLRYVCHYIDRRYRDKLLVIILSKDSFGIAETPFSRCLRIS